MASDPAKEALPAEKEEDLDFSGKFPVTLNEVVLLPAGCPQTMPTSRSFQRQRN